MVDFLRVQSQLLSKFALSPNLFGKSKLVGLVYMITLMMIFTSPMVIADEPSSIPKHFTAYIGGFFGPSYRIELNDGVVTYYRNKERLTITPTPVQWYDFRQALDQLKVWRWRTNYPSQGTADGTQWSLEIAYGDHALKSSGSNNYPDLNGEPNNKPQWTQTFGFYLAAVRKLIGDKNFE
jgi:hypothetical protein